MKRGEEGGREGEDMKNPRDEIYLVLSVYVKTTAKGNSVTTVLFFSRFFHFSTNLQRTTRLVVYNFVVFGRSPSLFFELRKVRRCYFFFVHNR